MTDQIIKSHYYELQRDIQPQTLAVVMFQKGLLNEKEHISISKVKSRDDAADQLIRTLAGKGEAGLIGFIECLNEDNSKKEHYLLAENLKKELPLLL
ncbi:hypothetical protein LOD99_13112 [Oopsacas minuta]|uniref:CARD domain-containing protein n=1 Tax=Oopsacas minuta TaxID=111878 RepID=A0AAV7JAX2_9METZ|nr:hypothetical protein LOD99_13112 [Oopsacas minuta]